MNLKVMWYSCTRFCARNVECNMAWNVFISGQNFMVTYRSCPGLPMLYGRAATYRAATDQVDYDYVFNRLILSWNKHISDHTRKMSPCAGCVFNNVMDMSWKFTYIDKSFHVMSVVGFHALSCHSFHLLWYEIPVPIFTLWKTKTTPTNSAQLPNK